VSHTPGPWTMHQPAKFDSYQVEDRLIAANGEHVAEVYQYRSETKNAADGTALANARLITAAPDLYESAKSVIAAFDAGVFVRDIRNDSEPGWAIKAFPHLRALGQLVAAVDKAEGQVEKVEAAKS